MNSHLSLWVNGNACMGAFVPEVKPGTEEWTHRYAINLRDVPADQDHVVVDVRVRLDFREGIGGERPAGQSG